MTLFTLLQFYTSSPDYEPPFPKEGFAFLDGLVASITANEPDSYKYGYVACSLSNKPAVRHSLGHILTTSTPVCLRPNGTNSTMGPSARRWSCVT